MGQNGYREEIPSFNSIEEEAAFWDSHDLADYWKDFSPSKVQFASRLSEAITIRIDADTLEKLRSAAEQRGMAPATLARSWIAERLKSGPES